MKHKQRKIILKVIITFLILLLTPFLFYIFTMQVNKCKVGYCAKNSSDKCYSSMFELFLPKLLMNEVTIDGDRNIELIRLDSTTRISSVYALEQSDVLLGYGVGADTNFEDSYSKIFNKPSFAFDCGVRNYKPKHKLCSFYSECIVSDKYLLSGQKSSYKVHTLGEKINELNLQNKKIYIKMDVAEADVVVLPELLKHSDQITGMSIALHMNSSKDVINRMRLIEKLNKKFVLISRSTLYTTENEKSFVINSRYYPYDLKFKTLLLSYINKNLVDDYKILMVQNSDNYHYKKYKVYKIEEPGEHLPPDNIPLIVVLTEKIRLFLYKNFRGE